MLNVLLVDPSRIFAEALAERLEREWDLSVVAAVGSVDAVPHHVDAVDVAVCDEYEALSFIAAPAMAGPGARSNRLLSRPHVVVLAETGSHERATALVEVGIAGWVTRDQSIELLLEAIRGAANGETRIPPGLLTRVLRDLTAARQRRDEVEDRLNVLTEREREILALLGAGLDRAEVAARLHLSQHTVRTHLQNIRTSLAVHSTLAAVALARPTGAPAAAAG